MLKSPIANIQIQQPAAPINSIERRPDLVHEKHAAHGAHESKTILQDGSLEWLVDTRHLVEERAV